MNIHYHPDPQNSDDYDDKDFRDKSDMLGCIPMTVDAALVVGHRECALRDWTDMPAIAST